MSQRVGKYRERRGELPRAGQISLLREKWEATRQKRVDERQRLKRIEQEDLRRRMEDLRRRIDSLLMEANNVQSQLVSEQMKREARELIGRLESIKISAPHMKEVPHCVICMIQFVVGEDVCRTSCHQNHIFHTDCLRQWLERRKSCPLCKTAVSFKYV